MFGTNNKIAFLRLSFCCNSPKLDAFRRGSYTAITMAISRRFSCRILATIEIHKGASALPPWHLSRNISRAGGDLRVQSVLWKLARESVHRPVEMISLSLAGRKSRSRLIKAEIRSGESDRRRQSIFPAKNGSFPVPLSLWYIAAQRCIKIT